MQFRRPASPVESVARLFAPRLPLFGFQYRPWTQAFRRFHLSDPIRFGYLSACRL